jgi:predicted  nucleic acid-binding Zn-ribbon protein
MASTPKSDKYIALENEIKDIEKKIKSNRSDINKAQKEKAQIEEKLSGYLDLEETLSDELNNKRLEFSKMKAERVIMKDFGKQIKDKDVELEKIKRDYEKRLLSKEKDIERIRDEYEKRLQNKDKEIDKINDALQTKQNLIKQTRDAHAMAECPNSGIYLLRLETTEKLKTKFRIPDNLISKNTYVYKYGRSNDVNSRKEQHNQSLGKYIEKDLELIHSKLVSHYDCSTAETKVKKFLQEKDCYFISESLDGTKHKELVCINNKMIDEIKMFYNTL